MHRVCSVYPVKYNETSIITELYQCLKKVFKGNVTPTMHPISQHGSDQVPKSRLGDFWTQEWIPMYVYFLATLKLHELDKLS